MANKSSKAKPTLDNLDDVVDASTVADVLGLSVDTVRAYAREGALKCVRCGRKYRFRKTWVIDFLERS